MERAQFLMCLDMKAYTYGSDKYVIILWLEKLRINRRDYVRRSHYIDISQNNVCIRKS